jgi:UDP-glucose:(glucosyl)LPS alpha-1,2-glucosyltransferase
MSGIAWNRGSGGSDGGIEFLARQLERRMPADLMEQFQIHPGVCVPDLVNPGKIQVFWVHHGPTAVEHMCLAQGGWQRFARIIFVSNWQARNIISLYDIPWSRCQVIRNAVELVPAADAKFRLLPASTPVRLAYTSVPDRGLAILAAVFDEICRHRDDVELDVFSSFALYGDAWAPLDSRFEPVFDMLRTNPRVRCHGRTPNPEVLATLSRSHVFAYPATVPETSCLSLMEAMSGGLACVHPDYGGLSETAAGWTRMYEHVEDIQLHAGRFYRELMAVITALRAGDAGLLTRLASQKAFADQNYSWDSRARQWESVLRDLAGHRTEVPQL